MMVVRLLLLLVLLLGEVLLASFALRCRARLPDAIGDAAAVD